MSKSQAQKKKSRQLKSSEHHLLTKRFQAKKGNLVRLVTYDGFQDVRVSKVHNYDFSVEDAPNISKIAVLMAFPVADMAALKAHIKYRKDIVNEKLEPIKKRVDRPQIDFKVNHRNNVEIVLRNGLEMTGVVDWIDRYTIVLKLGENLVLIYKHAVYSFQPVSTDANPSEVNTDAIL